MQINIGDYLELLIKNSKYSKKDICNILNERYKLGNKELSYTTFSNNLKSGEISLNEAIAIATIIDIDFNKIVNVYKNKYNLLNSKESMKMEKIIAQILTSEGFVKGVEFKEENVYEIDKYDCYEGYYLSENGETVIMLRVLMDSFNNGDTEMGIIQEVSYFSNFLEILGEMDMTVSEFNQMPLNERLALIAKEGEDALAILGEDMREKEFLVRNYIK